MIPVLRQTNGHYPIVSFTCKKPTGDVIIFLSGISTDILFHPVVFPLVFSTVGRFTENVPDFVKSTNVILYRFESFGNINSASDNFGTEAGGTTFAIVNYSDSVFPTELSNVFFVFVHTSFERLLVFSSTNRKPRMVSSKFFS